MNISIDYLENYAAMNPALDRITVGQTRRTFDRIATVLETAASRNTKEAEQRAATRRSMLGALKVLSAALDSGLITADMLLTEACAVLRSPSVKIQPRSWSADPAQSSASPGRTHATE